MSDLVYLTPNTEEPFTTSEVIAECAGVKRDTVQKLIQRHEKDLREFARVGFEIRTLAGTLLKIADALGVGVEEIFSQSVQHGK